MCIKIQRYYMCRTRDGRLVDTEEEKQQKGTSHYPGLFVHPCSTPLKVPEIDHKNPTAADVLPCQGTEDLRDEYYFFPCPACQGLPPYLLDGKPDRVVKHNFFMEEHWDGIATDTDYRKKMADMVEEYAEALGKSIFCWVDIHWSDDLEDHNFDGGIVDIWAPQLKRQMVDTCLDLICPQEPQHGFRDGGWYPDHTSALNDCPPCHLRTRLYDHNPAMELRSWMNKQTRLAHHLVREEVQYEIAWDKFPFDLRRHWRKVPIKDMKANPYFEFVPTEDEPDLSTNARLQRVTTGEGPMFGLEAAHRIAQFRCEKKLVHFGPRGSKRPAEALLYNKPLSDAEVAHRRSRLDWMIAEKLKAYKRRAKTYDPPGLNQVVWLGLQFIKPILAQVADILSHDSGLLEYKIIFIMDYFLRKLDDAVEDRPDLTDPVYGAFDRQSPRGTPYYQKSYPENLFKMILANMHLYDGHHAELGFRVIPDQEPPPGTVFYHHPWWIVRESDEALAQRRRDYKDRYEQRDDLMRNKARYIDALTVKYIPGRNTDECTLCRKRMWSERAGPMICRSCKLVTGYEGEGKEEFGDAAFEKKVRDGADPIEKWKCFLCLKPFDLFNPDAELPIEYPAETIRCHGKHTTMIAGSACLKFAMLGEGDQFDKKPRCLVDRRALCVWDQNEMDHPNPIAVVIGNEDDEGGGDAMDEDGSVEDGDPMDEDQPPGAGNPVPANNPVVAATYHPNDDLEETYNLFYRFSNAYSDQHNRYISHQWGERHITPDVGEPPSISQAVYGNLYDEEQQDSS